MCTVNDLGGFYFELFLIKGFKLCVVVLGYFLCFGELLWGLDSEVGVGLTSHPPFFLVCKTYLFNQS